MSQEKRTPRSDNDRSTALSAAKTKKDASLPGDNVISVENSAALDIQLPLFDAKKELLVIAQSNLHKIVEAFNGELDILKNRTSHGLQSLNDQIKDKVIGFSASDRTLYGMTLDGHLPIMQTAKEIMLVAGNFVKGENDRVVAGGPPLTMITRSEIVAKLASLNLKLLDRSAKEKLVADATLVMVNLRKVVDPLIVNIWKDVENGGQKLEAPARRVFEASWGVVYNAVKSYGFLNVKCVDSATKIVLRGINLRLGPAGGKGGTKAITDDFGVALMKSRNFEPTFITGENMNYELESQEVTLVEGETIVIVLNMILKAIV